MKRETSKWVKQLPGSLGEGTALSQPPPVMDVGDYKARVSKKWQL